MNPSQIHRCLKLIIIIGAVLFAQRLQATDIVGYSLLTGSAGAATSGEAMNYPGLGRTLTPTGLTTTSYTSNGLTGSSWDNNGVDGFYTNAFSTTGYLATAVVGQIKGSSTGPKYIKVQYSMNGSNWIDVPNHLAYSDDNPSLVLGTTFTPFKFRLPAECDNELSVYVRWIQNGTTSIGNGTVTPSGTVSMKAVVMQSDILSPPTSQTSSISIISVTPTTITVGCTPGSGNRRILVMNTVNSFTDPADDYNPTANTIYSSGEQVVYNGSGSTVVVTVPSSLNTYWFRYYDYNQLDNLTRYCLLDASSNGNPKLCALPFIHSPTYSFGLVMATLGATIDENNAGPIIDRGIYWGTSTGISTSSIGVQDLAPSDGAYSLETEVDRGSTIYFKGYAENESGVILTDEVSFSNRPIFTGVGNWEIPSLWNTNEVPGENGDPNWGSVLDSPTINGTCTMSVSKGCTDITINNGKSLTINPAVSLVVNGVLTNNSTEGLIVKASDSQANGSIVFADPSSNSAVPATVEMYSKASWNLGATVPQNSRYKWQYFGIPVNSVTAIQSFYKAHVRRWDETGDSITNHWVSLDDQDVLSPFLGYEVCQENPKTYVFKGNLVVDDFEKNNLAYTDTALYPGQHIFANPYTAAIDISSLAGMFGSNMEESVYLYNTGSYDQWDGANGSLVTGNNAGQYTVSTPATVGEMGVPTQIPSMQAFLVKVISDNPTNSSLAFPYSSIAVQNTEMQRAPKINRDNADDRMVLRIDVAGEKTSDQMWFFVDESRTRKFDNGWDGRKLFGSIQSPQLFAMEEDGFYQIDALSDINNSEIGFKKGFDNEYVLNISHKNLNKMYANVYLQDLLANKVVDITQSGTLYSFSAPNQPSSSKRFKILVRYHTKSDNGEPSLLKAFSAEKSIYVQNSASVVGEAMLYDMFGHFVCNCSISSNTIQRLPVNLTTGAYLVRTSCDTEIFTQRITVK